MKYAKWKAVDITKALKEGRTPMPGPLGGEPALQQPGFEENNQDVNNLHDNDPFPSAQISSDSAATTTEPPPSSDNDPFPLFPSAPTQDQPKPSSNNSVTGTFPNVQNLVSSFDQIDIIRNQVAPPLPPKVSDYAGNNINLSDYQFIQQPSSTPNYSPPPSANQVNFYDIHQNHKQPPLPQPPSSIPHTSFTNDSAQPQQPPPQQPPPQQPPPLPHHNPFIPHPQAPPQNYIQPVNLISPPPHQPPSFSATGPYTTSQQRYDMYSYSQPPQAVIDPATVATVQKYCKFAGSALDYHDVKTAVDYMNKALEALKPYNK